MDIVSHIPSSQKSILGRADNILKSMCHSPHKNLENNLINDIATRDQSKISSQVSIGWFWDKGNDRMVDLLEQMSRCKKILDHIIEITRHYTPCFLEEQGWVSSSPGAFSLLMLKRVCWIRSSVTGPKKKSWEAASRHGPQWMTSSLMGMVCFVEPRRFL